MALEVKTGRVLEDDEAQTMRHIVNKINRIDNLAGVKWALKILAQKRCAPRRVG